ncbi:hypothetical protein [Chryseobacterium wangxinyae]|uniref:hypothetical protein n=1 Tax=Chryseobacterium sp. CY353 TaxID=2997334 RepID=UPI00227149AF|nr:hypothetical protein [Chryseobacterium sp. CY353]MCY0967893.1 hypothetical protein [Chryseobacterium sp. CY353]
MRERIWFEMVDAKLKSIYCGLYLAKQRTINKWFNIIIVVFSTSGVLGWSFWKDLPFATSIIIMIMSIVKLLGTELIPNDNTFKKIEKSIDLYCDYYNKLENLWYEFDNDKIDNDKAQRKFYLIVAGEKDISKIINEVIKTKNSSFQDKAEIECNKYFDNIFNLNSNG